MNVHHVGYAVFKLGESVDSFKKLGYHEENATFSDNSRNVHIQFMKNDYQVIELIAPMNNNSPIFNILKKSGATPYHICFETKDINNEIDLLTKDKYILLQSPSEAIALKNKKVAFLFKKNVGIIELVEIS